LQHEPASERARRFTSHQTAADNPDPHRLFHRRCFIIRTLNDDSRILLFKPEVAWSAWGKFCFNECLLCKKLIIK
jgi:hypothetical protein